jgi:hypothetical protein
VFAVVISALLMAAADPTPSAAAAGVSPPPVAVAAAAPEKKHKGSDRVCWEERPTGSHVTTHVCATRDQLDDAQHAGQALVSSTVQSPPAIQIGRGALSPR